MKTLLRSLFAFVLNPLEAGDGEFVYRSSHRKVLLIIGVLFSGLGLLVAVLAQGKALGYLFPAVVFGALGLLALIVGSVGNDRAVAKIWGNQQDG